MSNARHTVRRRRRVMIALALMASSAASLLWWIQSDHLPRKVEAYVHRASAGRVQIDDISFRSPGRFHVGRLSLINTRGVAWLTAGDITCSLRLLSLAGRTIDVRSLSVGRIDLDMPGRSSSPSDSTALPILSWSVALERFSIGQFTLSSNMIPGGLKGHAEGYASWPQREPLRIGLEGTSTWRELPAIAWEAAMIVEPDGVDIGPATLQSGADRLEGRGSYMFQGKMMSASARFDVLDVEPYLPDFLPWHVRGPLKGTVAISRDLDGGRDAVSWDLESSELTSSGMAAEEVACAGAATRATGAWNLDARCSMGSLLHAAMEFHDVQATWEGQRETAAWRLSGLAKAGNRTAVHVRDMSGQGGMLSSGGFQTGIDVLDALWNGHDVSLPAAATLSGGGGRFDLDMPSVAIGGMTSRFSTAISGGAVARLELESLDLPIPRVLDLMGRTDKRMNGRVSISMDFKRDQGVPQGTLMAQFGELAADVPVLRHFAGIEGHVIADVGVSNLVFRLAADHPSIEQLFAEGRMPLHATGGVIPWRIDASDPLSAQLRFRGNLKHIGERMISGPSSIGGRFDVDLEIDHVTGQPLFKGGLTLEDGVYRNIDTGTFLRHANVDIRGSSNRLIVSSATARDGGNGTLTAFGGAQFDSLLAPEWRLVLFMTNASLFRLVRTDVPLSGHVVASSVAGDYTLAGNLWIEPFAFTIPKRLPSGLRRLDVIEINHPDPLRNTGHAMAGKGTDAASRSHRDARINLMLRTRERFEVGGRGLTSWWDGEMRLHGTTVDPMLSGHVSLSEGRVMLLGRRFRLDDGRIQFTGEIPPNPRINASATTGIGGEIARILVSGTIQSPLLELVSDPPRSREEVMAMILFGKTADTISPWQAIALANGLRILSGSADLADVIDSSQTLLRIDQFDIRQNEEGDGLSSLAVGKYIGPSLYVEGEKGFDGAEDAVSVTIDLSPRLTLKTEASPRIREGISLLWRRDF